MERERGREREMERERERYGENEYLLLALRVRGALGLSAGARLILGVAVTAGGSGRGSRTRRHPPLLLAPVTTGRRASCLRVRVLQRVDEATKLALIRRRLAGMLENVIARDNGTWIMEHG